MIKIDHVKALEAVRATGKVNMMASAVVVQMLLSEGYGATAKYLMDDRGRVDRNRYIELLKQLGESRN